MATWPSVAQYQQQTYHLLTEAHVVLDIGCGPGVDLVGLGADVQLASTGVLDAEVAIGDASGACPKFRMHE